MLNEEESQLENIPEHLYDEGREHPTPEQLLIREAIKHLKPSQLKVWEMHMYDLMTEAEIALKLGVSQPAVHYQIGTIEKHIAKFCKQNRGAYMLLKLEQKIDREGE